jgi:aromatic ring-opening dioxygenase LigB subunit
MQDFFSDISCEKKTVLKITVNSQLQVIVNTYHSSQRVSAVLANFKCYKNVQHTWGLMTTLSFVKRNEISLFTLSLHIHKDTCY